MAPTRCRPPTRTSSTASPPRPARRSGARSPRRSRCSSRRRADHRARADALLDRAAGAGEPALRIGISGVPGVGKSTFIETLGLHLIGAGPSRRGARGRSVARASPAARSSATRRAWSGSRSHERAFVRPSPSGGTLGGVAAATREAIRVVEAAGFDVVIVETVGVGQSEAAVAGMTDMFVLMQLPNAGDDLQAIKKGVIELADLVVVNKADLDPAAAARARRPDRIGAARSLAPRDGASVARRGCWRRARSTGPGAPRSGDAVARFGRRSDAPAARSPAAPRAPGARLAVGAHRRRPARALPRRRRGAQARCRRRWPRSTPAGCRSRSARATPAGAFAARRRRRALRMATTDPSEDDHARHHPAARSQARAGPPRRRREAHRRAARQGQAHRARADRAAARRRLVRGMGHVRRAPQPRLRHGEEHVRRATASSPATA